MDEARAAELLQESSRQRRVRGRDEKEKAKEKCIVSELEAEKEEQWRKTFEHSVYDTARDLNSEEFSSSICTASEFETCLEAMIANTRPKELQKIWKS